MSSTSKGNKIRKSFWGDTDGAEKNKKEKDRDKATASSSSSSKITASSGSNSSNNSSNSSSHKDFVAMNRGFRDVVIGRGYRRQLKTDKEKDEEIARPDKDKATVSIAMDNASRAMGRVLDGYHVEHRFKGGYRKCVEMMDEKKIIHGRILCILRSFKHHHVREDGGSSYMPKTIINLRAMKKLKKMGQESRYVDCNTFQTRASQSSSLEVVAVFVVVVVAAVVAVVVNFCDVIPYIEEQFKSVQ